MGRVLRCNVRTVAVGRGTADDFFGQYFVSEWKGRWRVQGDRTKPFFLDIVVDQFEGPGRERLITSPLESVAFYMNSDPGRSLARMLADRTMHYPDR